MAPSSSNKPRQAGFTLVELMVVLAVMGLLAGVAVWRWPSGSDLARTQAVQLASRIAAARDQAVIEARPIALVVDSAGYRFEVLRGGEWKPSTEPSLAERQWPGKLDLVSASPEQRVRFDVVGLPDRTLDLQLRSGEGTAGLRLLADGEVQLS